MQILISVRKLLFSIQNHPGWLLTWILPDRFWRSRSWFRLLVFEVWRFPSQILDEIQVRTMGGPTCCPYAPDQCCWEVQFCPRPRSNLRRNCYRRLQMVPTGGENLESSQSSRRHGTKPSAFSFRPVMSQRSWSRCFHVQLSNQRV